MGLAIIVKDLGQILARHTHQVRTVVVSSRNDHFAATVVVNPPKTVAGRDVETIISADDGFYALILPHIEVVMLRNLAIVLERFQPIRLRIRAAEGYVADLQQLRR